MRKYTSKGAARQPEPFELDGVVFTPAAQLSFLDITNLARFADTEMGSPAGVAAIGDFFAQLLGDDYERFREHVRKHRTDEETLLGVLSDIIEDVVGHPSTRSSASPVGPMTTGRSLRVVSLSQGTVSDESLVDEARAAELQAQIEAQEQQAG